MVDYIKVYGSHISCSYIFTSFLLPFFQMSWGTGSAGEPQFMDCLEGQGRIIVLIT